MNLLIEHDPTTADDFRNFAITERDYYWPMAPPLAIMAHHGSGTPFQVRGVEPGFRYFCSRGSNT